MKAAVVPQAGRAPVYGDLNEQAPAAGESRVVVTAAALSPVVKARASGTHYSAPGSFPIGVGIDGVGRLDDGSRNRCQAERQTRLPHAAARRSAGLAAGDQ